MTVVARVLIVGGGMGGIAAAKKLADAPVEVTLVGGLTALKAGEAPMALALRGGMLHTFSERTNVHPGSKALARSVWGADFACAETRLLEERRRP